MIARLYEINQSCCENTLHAGMRGSTCLVRFYNDSLYMQMDALVCVCVRRYTRMIELMRTRL